MVWASGHSVRATGDLLMIIQKADHLLPDPSWPQVTETSESKTIGKDGQLYKQQQVS